MPTFDAAAQADAQVTVAIVLAGFAFAGFILLMDNLRDSNSSESRALYFQSMFLLAATFSIGTLASFFYALSRGLAPWDAYRGLVFGHTLFTLETLALIASVGWLLGIYAPHYFRRRAWWITVLISGYALCRLAAELVRHVRAGEPGVGHTVAICAVAGFAAVAPIPFVLRQMKRAASRPIRATDEPHPGDIEPADTLRQGETRRVMKFVFGLAGASMLVAAPQLLFTFVEADGPLPLGVALWLMAVTGALFAWTVSISWPAVREGETVDDLRRIEAVPTDPPAGDAAS